MTAIELFKKACEAWGVETRSVLSDSDIGQGRLAFFYKGKEIKTRWESVEPTDPEPTKLFDELNEVALISAILCQLLEVLVSDPVKP